MKETGILMVAEMVRRTLVWNKTQTRRIMKPQPEEFDGEWVTRWERTSGDPVPVTDPFFIERCPYGRSGDRLWVREAHWRYGIWRKNGVSKTGKQKWKFHALPHDLGLQFTAPGPKPKRGRKGWHKRPSIFMPRISSRITLEIVSVRVERVQDISEEDARAEGITFRGTTRFEGEARVLFHSLWDSINAKRGFGWDANPWVWVLEFRRVKP